MNTKGEALKIVASVGSIIPWASFSWSFNDYRVLDLMFSFQISCFIASQIFEKQYQE
jgi:hypothetical protein